MKRYAFTFAVMAITACVLLYMFGLIAAIIIAAVCCLLAVLSVLFLKNEYKKPISVMLLAVAIFCLYIAGFQRFKIDKTENLIYTTADINCVVIEKPSDVGDKTVLLVKTTDENNELHKNLKLELWVSNELEAASAVCGDILNARVVFKEIDEAYKASNFAEGIYLSNYVENIEIVGHKDILYKYFVDFRSSIERYITKNFNLEHRSVLSGVLLGNTSLMSDKIYSDFKICGVIHVTAVSGMHISILCGAFLGFFSLFMRKRTASLITLIPLFAVIATVGFTPSAVRAGIMCSLVLLGNAFLEKTDGLNSLGVSVTLMLLFNPYYICSIGFNLSCLATAGVIVFSRYANVFIEKHIHIKTRLVEIIVCSAILVFVQSIGAVLFTLPLQIIYFGFVSLIAPIASVLICGAISYLLVVSVFTLVFYFVDISFVMQVFVLVSKLLCEYVVRMVDILARIPFSYIAFSDRYVLLWAALSLALIGLWILLNNIGGIRAIALGISALFLVAVWSQNIFERNAFELAMLNVETGFMAAVANDETVVIIGCGDDNSDYNSVKAYMKLSGKTKVDALIVPSYSDYCYGGYKGVDKHLSPKKVILPDNIADKQVIFNQNGIKITAVNAKHGFAFEVNINETIALVNCCGEPEEKVKYDYLIGTAASIDGLKANAAVITGNLSGDNREKIKRIVDIEDKSVTIKITNKKGYKIYAG